MKNPNSTMSTEEKYLRDLNDVARFTCYVACIAFTGITVTSLQKNPKCLALSLLAMYLMSQPLLSKIDKSAKDALESGLKELQKKRNEEVINLTEEDFVEE